MSTQTDLYDGMLADIYTLTKRPDLDAETNLALRTATNNAHFCDAFPRDCSTMLVQLPTSAYLAQLDLPTLFPGFRGISKIRQLDVNFQPMVFAPDQQIEVIELSDIYDDYGTLRSNVAYVAGDKINIRSVIASHGFTVTWFQAPRVRREQYNSWIAQLYPEIILYWAASIVLDTNGNEQKAAKYMGMTQQIHIPFLKSNFLQGEMR